MKKYNIYSLLLMLLVIFTGCKEENIIFEIELPQFETREGYQLLEVIMPFDTGENDEIYITGDFNGGEDAIGNPLWLMTKGPGSTVKQSKWGIYIDPSTFLNGKTLADGYSFYNVKSGEAKTLDNTPAVFYNSPALGGRADLFVYFWASNFEKPSSPDDIQHDGYAIYVLDTSGWKDTYLYSWEEPDNKQILGAWPGSLPTGTVQINGTTYKYWDTGSANEGLNCNFIFNNNEGVQLPDLKVTLNKDYYLEMTGEDVYEINPNDQIEHDGYAVFVYNNTGWENVYLYMWGEVNDLNGPWPGMAPTGTITINGVGFLYFDFGAANEGLGENLIFNNGDGSQLSDYGFTINSDLYVEISTKGVTVIENPESFDPNGSGNTPEEPEEPNTPDPDMYYELLVENATGWSEFYIYAYGAQETDQIFGGWPGKVSTDTRTIEGVEYLVYEVPGGNTEYTLIFHDNGDNRVEQNTVIVSDQNWYINVTAKDATILDAPTFYIYADNQSGWSNLYLYGYGDAGNSFFGGWPGLLGVAKEVNGVSYIAFPFEGNGKSENLIFNNGEGDQLEDLPVLLNQDLYITVTSEGAQMK